MERCITVRGLIVGSRVGVYNTVVNETYFNGTAEDTVLEIIVPSHVEHVTVAVRHPGYNPARYDLSHEMTEFAHFATRDMIYTW